MSVDRTDYRNASDTVRNEAVKQYLPLINKITAQHFRKLKTDWNTIYSMALEGFNEAMNIYDPNESKQNFMQFAAYRMRFMILNSTGVELHTVTLSYYAQQKVQAELGDTFTSVSMIKISGETGGEDSYSREGVYGLYNYQENDDDPVANLVGELSLVFPERTIDFFIRYYGLLDVEPVKAKDLAVEYGVSGSLVSQSIKSVITYIRTRPDLLDDLSKLFEDETRLV